MTTKIFIVEDEPTIVEVLTAYLEREGFDVYTAASGAMAIKKIKEIQPDFILLDLMLPDITGEEICRIIREDSDVPIMMLTAKSAEDDRIHGITIGADDYITKPFSPREVIARIHRILQRTQRNRQKETLSFNGGELVINPFSNEVTVRGNTVPFTPLEFKLLTVLAENPGRVYTRLNLLEKVQNETYEGYERNIDVHIKNIRKKIEIDSRSPQYILTVFGIGYKFGGKSDVSHSTY